jgi:tetratricopeptide (TPR) repeat protein
VAEAISLQPNNLDMQLLLVRIVASEGQASEARAILSDLENDFGRQTRISLVRSLVTRLDQGNEAAYQYLKGEWEQTNDVGLLPEAIALANQVAPSEIGALASSWTQLQPNNPMGWLTYGDWELARGNNDEAIAHYRQVLTLQPTNVLAMNNLAWLVRDSDPSEAVQLASQAAERAPNNPAILDTYGWVLHGAGEHQQALEVLNRALELDPGNAEIEGHLAQVEAAVQ